MFQRLTRLFFSVIVISIFAVTSTYAREPQKLGDTRLDHRVLTRPGALLLDAPGSGSTVARPSVFSVYYVFSESDVAGGRWLEVGANRTAGDTFWLDAEKSVDWKQTIVVGFTNPANRLPSVFFDTCTSVEEFLSDEAMSTRAELLTMAIRQGDGTGDSGVIAVEPEEHVDLSSQFYMLPILDHKRLRVNRRPKRILEVASINLDETPKETDGQDGPFSVGVVFVIDTSTSMQDYISATKEAVKRLIQDIRNTDTDAEAEFSFGMVGFRSSTDIVPGLEYTSKVYHPLEPDFDEEAFLSAIRDMNATRVSSHDFDEDGLSGIAAAAAMPEWDHFGGRYIIYISDAGMLVGADSGASSDATPELIATQLETDLGIATFAMPLQTPAGRAYHDDSANQLEAMTYLETERRSFVFPIENGDVGAFASSVSSLTEALLKSVSQKAGGQTNEPDPCGVDPDSMACAVSGPQHAMQLAWLGRQNQTQAPDLYRACVPAFALDDPRRRALSPRVLLTRAQLNDMYVTLQSIVEAYRVGSDQTSPEKFFKVISTVLARVVRDPSALQSLDSSSRPNTANFEDFDDLEDLLADHLQDLPYDSDLGQITVESWQERGASGRHEFIEGIKAKLSMYELYYADTDNWVALTASAEEAEKVYPLPLEMMP